MNTETEKPMRYFFNDVEVTEAEYKDRMAESTVDACNKFTMSPEIRKAEPAGKPKAKGKSRPVAKMPAPVVEKVAKAEPAKKGSKTAIAASIITKIGAEKKAECIQAIMDEFNTSKANASCYFFNVLKKGASDARA